MAYSISKKPYASKLGMKFEVVPCSITDITDRFTEDEASYPLIRAIEGKPDKDYFAAVAMPVLPPEYSQMATPKAYIVGIENEGTIPHQIVRTADTAPGHGFGRIMLAHSILDAARNYDIESYIVTAAAQPIKNLLRQINTGNGALKNGVNGKNGPNGERTVIDFSKEPERWRLAANVNDWLKQYKP
jgi:hypothetical protein